jgi:O-antigen ligase
MLTQRAIIRELAGALTGYTIVWEVEVDDRRLGLVRAMSTFGHPIMLGIACAIGLLIAVSVPIRSRKFAIPACGFGAICALSAAPLQSIFLGFVLLSYNRAMSGVRFRWLAPILLGAAALMTFFMVLDAPFGFIFRHFTFDDASAYWRLWTWNVAGDALAQSPWFGLGFAPYPEEFGIPRTVDSVWLNQALTFGIPGSLLIGFSILGAVSLSTNGRKAGLTAAESKLGTVLGILIFLIIFWGFTVDFYGALWVLVPLVIGMRAHLGELGRIGSGAHFTAVPSL